MDEIEFLWIGWCKEGTLHDKVWVAFKVGGKYYAGWGRRGKKIRFKLHYDGYELQQVRRKKEKTYDEVDRFQLFSIFPYFKNEVEKYLDIAILTNQVM